MQSLIESNYFNSQKLNISRLYVDLQLACRDMSIQTPHINTLRKRIQERSESELIRRRHGRKAEEDLNRPIRGKYEKAKFPLSIVQIDHTLLDIFLVDEDTRRPIGRPWITVAIDVYSRMITGFYISFDPPSASTVGLCLSNSILPKEDFMLKNNIEGEWPCWGVMKVVHADNAKEFKGNMLRKACQEYGIDIQWRPVTTPHWGGHIERLIGSLNTEIHSLPGTTFSKTSDRKNYNSEKKASFSLSEFEQYLTTFILGVYHERKHSSLGLSPIYKYKEGLLGSANFSGYGLPAKIRNEDKLRKDFMPFFERSIQNYGVKIDNITYYHDVLRRWINAKESGSSSVKRKFLFRRDPRDISIIYFLDPEEERYYPIPYLNISHPSISIWEYRDALKKLTEDGLNSVDEDKIFDTYKSLTKIKENSTKTTLVNKRKRHTKNGRLNVHQTTPEGSVFKDNDMDFSAIKPFEDIDHDAYKK